MGRKEWLYQMKLGGSSNLRYMRYKSEVRRNKMAESLKMKRGVTCWRSLARFKNFQTGT